MRQIFRHAFAIVLLASSAIANAQAFPSKPIKIVVPFPAGGTVDFFARVVSTKLSESLGQSVLVENRAGAGGNIAVGPVLLGAAKPVHILTPSATVRRIVNMTALTVADANAVR